MTAPAGRDWDLDGVVEPVAAKEKKGRRESAAVSPAPEGEFAHLPLAVLDESPRNPRKHYDAAKLAELTESVRASGILAPLVVRPTPKGRYEIGAGHINLGERALQ